jgi:uncharacterized repeat protein (TIGR03803 family)
MKSRINKRLPSLAFTVNLSLNLGLILGLLMQTSLLAAPYTVLHSFGTNTMGLNPHSTLVQGSDGKLYGTTEWGGRANLGQIFSVNTDGTGYTVLRDFSGDDGAMPLGKLVLSGATLYGTTSYGGSFWSGTVFKIGTDGSGYCVLRHFNYADAEGFVPNGDLVLAGTTLYGTASDVVFRIETDGSGYAVFKRFNGDSGGGAPATGLVLSGTTFYGTASGGGTAGNGTLFRINTDGSGFRVLKDFPTDVGPLTGLVLAGNVLYGLNFSGGAYGWGLVARINTDGTGLAVLGEFDGTNGANPNLRLVLAGDALYGLTAAGGTDGVGTIFKLNTNGGGICVLRDLPRHQGNDFAYLGDPLLSGLTLSGTVLYGTTLVGGLYGYGSVFTLSTDGSDYRVLTNFEGGDGTRPGAVILSDTTLYGVTREGGGANSGIVFKISTNGSGYTILKDFTNLMDGGYPCGQMVLDRTTLYGTAAYGGLSNCGTLFRLNTDGSSYTVLKDFTDVLDGSNPSGELVLAGTTIYGTAMSGGLSNCGTVFRINTDGSGYRVLKHFMGSDGSSPAAGVGLADTLLFGATASGGGSDAGALFVLGTNGAGFSVLKDFGGQCGNPSGSPLLCGSTFFGAAGGWGCGALYRIDSDGSGFAVLRPSGCEEESSPQGKLCLSGSTLYGAGLSALYQINTDGSGFAVLKKFYFAEGYYPYSGPVLAGSTLFGSTTYGGGLDSGVVFSLSLAPAITTMAVSRTAELDDSMSVVMGTWAAPPVSYQWFYNGSNALAGCTGNQLQFDSLQFGQAGSYTLVISNAYGMITSAPAMVSVIPHVERRLVAGVRVTGRAGDSWRVEYADGIDAGVTWQTLATVTLTAEPQYGFDVADPLPPRRFYRASLAGVGGIPPTVSLHKVQDVTLSGPVGSSIRLDYINASGPVDAWVPLTAVVLTNASQPFFDVSALGQPPRLYRLVPVP